MAEQNLKSRPRWYMIYPKPSPKQFYVSSLTSIIALLLPFWKWKTKNMNTSKEERSRKSRYYLGNIKLFFFNSEWQNINYFWTHMIIFKTTNYSIKEFYRQATNLSLKAVWLLSYFQSISTCPPPPRGVFKAFYFKGQKWEKLF